MGIVEQHKVVGNDTNRFLINFAGGGDVLAEHAPHRLQVFRHLLAVGLTHLAGDERLHRTLVRAVAHYLDIDIQLVKQLLVEHDLCGKPVEHQGTNRVQEDGVGGSGEIIVALTHRNAIGVYELAALFEAQQRIAHRLQSGGTG